MHLTALGFGLGSLAVAAIAKATPNEWTKKFPVIKEEEDENSFAKKLENTVSGRFSNTNE